jgi:RHS repeat-associated protein
MVMPGRSFLSSGADYRFGFNGQEKNSDLSGVDGGHLDFKYRIHDARLGRFLSQDPLTAEYPWNSPYAFAENRVIEGLDYEGQFFLPGNHLFLNFFRNLFKKVKNEANIRQQNVKNNVSAMGDKASEITDILTDRIRANSQLMRNSPNPVGEILEGFGIEALNTFINVNSPIYSDGITYESASPLVNHARHSFNNVFVPFLLLKGQKPSTFKASTSLQTIKSDTKQWNQAIEEVKNLNFKGKIDIKVSTATEAKQFLKESRGSMNRYKQYSKDKGIKYEKGYEFHNQQNNREIDVGNDRPHIKWKDGSNSGHIFYDKPN